MIQKGFKVYFNLEKDNYFYVTSQKGVMSRFPVSKQGLYMMDKSESYPHTLHANREVKVTVIKDYTACQITQAKRASKGVVS